MNEIPMNEIERPLPHSLEAERSILGAVILDNHALSVAIEKLRAADFFLPQNRKIFEHMVELAEKQQPIETITLVEDLTRLDELESAGGIAYLSQLADGLPRVSNVEHYARIVKEKAVLRSSIYLGWSICERGFSGEVADESVIEKLRRLKAAKDQSCDWRSVFHTFEEFERARPLSFAIDGLLQNNGATLFGGLSDHGKTLILLSIVKALLIGKGHKLWNLFEVLEDAERVLYLIPESAIEPFKHRLKLFGIYPYLASDNERLLVRTLSKGPTPSLSDPRILSAAKGAYVFIDTAVRFGTGDENDADDNRKLANDIFALLNAGARLVGGAHHSPKPFAKENVMRLENVLRGSGDIGAMLVTAWGIKQLDAAENVIHVENIKPRDFQPCGPFQIIGRPFINEAGDFRLHKKPGECGSLQDEQQPERDKGGAPVHVREARAANIELLRQWLKEDKDQTSEELAEKFATLGINLSPVTVRKYKREL